MVDGLNLKCYIVPFTRANQHSLDTIGRQVKTNTVKDGQKKTSKRYTLTKRRREREAEKDKNRER